VGASLLVPWSNGFALNPGVLPSQYRHQAWGVAEGLPQSSVMAVVRDRRGYLWIGTQAGLARFDGSGLTVFDELSTPPLPDAVILSLAVDGDRLWIGSSTGLSVMEGARVDRVDLPGAEPRERITVLQAGAEGSVLAGTGGGRVYRLRGPRAEWVARIPLAPERPAVHALAELGDGQLWAGTDRGLWRLGPGPPRPILWTGGGGETRAVFDLLANPDGSVFAATESGLFAIGGAGASLEVHGIDLPGRGSAMVRCLERDRDGNLWAGTMGSGVYRGLGEPFVRMAPQSWPGLASLRCLLADQEGILWLGSFEHGLHSLADSPFLNFRAAEGVAGGAVRTVAASGGHLWVGSEGGLSLISRGRLERLPPPLLRLGSGVMSVLEAGDGTLWVGTDGDGVVRFRDGVMERWGRSRQLPHGVAAVLFEDRSGALWVGTDGGVGRLAGDRWEPYSVAEGLPGNVVTCLAQAADGTIVAGTMEGLSRMEGERFASWTTGAPAGPVTAVFFDPDGDLWLGVEGHGITLVDTTGAHTLDRRRGFPQRTVGAMVLGRDGLLWCAGMQGLTAVPWRQLKLFLQGRGQRPLFRTFTAEDGMASTECSTGTQPALTVAADGTLCVAAVAGVSCLPGGVPPPLPSSHGRVVIESVQVDGRRIAVDRPAELAPGVRTIELQFTSLAFLSSGEVRYVTRLEGLEEGWRDVDGDRKVLYTHLPPGRFVFRVRTITRGGLPLDDEARFELRVLPPLWRTPWFLALVGFIFLAAGPAVYVLRVTALKRRQVQLSSLIEERTAELRETAKAFEQMTLEDPLTAIPNYRAFGRDLERAWRNALRQGGPVSVIMADIDYFKVFNDAFGHLHGDECLRRVAAALSSCVHRPDDLVARYGGEEFVVLLPGTGTPGAARLAEQMRRAVEALQIECPRPDGVGVVTVSFGVASVFPLERDGSALLVAAADRALYRAKSSGRNRVEAASTPQEEPTGVYPSAVAGEGDVPD